MEVQSIPNHSLYKGEYAIVFRLTIDAPCRVEPRGCIDEYLTTRCCTRREIRLVIVANEASWCTMEAADGSKEEGIRVMSTTIPDPPEVGGIEAETNTGKGNHL